MHDCLIMQVDVFDEFARVTSALSASSRLKLLDRVCQGEQTVEELARAAELSVPNTSRQLRLLADARLIVSRREPPRIYYRIADESVVRFWFSLRDLARERLTAVDQAIEKVFESTDPLEPIGSEELRRRMESGDVILLDVRPKPEYRAGHLPGAISLPLPELRERLPELPWNREIVAYCRGPYCLLAAEAVRELRACGLKALRLADGLPEWRAAGLPVEVGAAG